MGVDRRHLSALLAAVIAAVLAAALAFAAPSCGRSNQPSRLVNLQATQSVGDLETAAPAVASAVTQLKELLCPEGVDSALWAELKDALKEALSKTTSTPPTGDANRVDDLAIADNGDGTYTLSWHYRNLGDYDQNGKVGISDITPIAMHYGEEVPAVDTEVNSIQAVIDGSGNGEVGIEDVTQIAMYFGIEVHHYSIEGASAEEGHWEAVSDVAQATGMGDSRKAYDALLAEAPLPFYHVVPVDSQGNRGEASNVALQPSLGPVIHSVSPVFGCAGVQCTFSAEVTGTEPLTYAWDFGGGAEPNASGDASPQVILGSIGMYPASLTVSNVAGEDTCEFTLAVTSSAGPWPMSGHDRRRTCKSEFLGPQGPGLKWRYHLREKSYAEPVVNQESRVYLGTEKMGLVAFKPDGAMSWQFEATEELPDSAAVGAGGTIYAGSWDGSLRAFTSSGSLMWELPLAGSCTQDLAIADDGTIIVGTDDASGICAVSAEGELLWRYQTDSWLTSRPAVADDGTVYFVCDDSCIYAVNPDGSLKWRLEDLDPTRPVIGPDGTIYTGWYHTLHAINPDGTIKWQKDHEFSGGIAAIDGERALYLYGSVSGVDSLHAFDFDGNELWCYDEVPVTGPPVIGADGTIYIGADDNRLLALAPDGTLMWQYQIAPSRIERSFKPSAIGADGTLYAVGGEFVYAFGGDPPPEADWTHTYSAASGDDMVTDAEGDIYMAGGTTGTDTGYDIALQKWSRDGRLQYAKAWGGPDEDRARDIALSPSGDVYVAGYTESFGAGWYDTLLLKYDAVGDLLWARTWGGEFIDRAIRIAVDDSGSIYVAGERSDHAFTPWKLFLLKCDSDGNLQFAESWYAGYSNSVHQILITNDGAVRVLDQISVMDNSHDPDRGVLFDFAPDGTLLRCNSFLCSEGDDYLRAYSVAGLGPSGNLYVAGYDGTLIEFNVTGELVSAARYDAQLRAICVGSDGTIHLTGSSEYLSYWSNDLLYLACAPDGTVLEQKVWCENNSSDGQCITIDEQGNVFVGGRANSYCGYWFDINSTRTVPTVEMEPIESTMIALQLTETSPEGTQSDIAGIVDLIPEDEDDSQFILFANPPT